MEFAARERAAVGPPVEQTASTRILKAWSRNHVCARIGESLCNDNLPLSTHAVLHPATLAAAALGVVLATTQIDVLRLSRQFASPIAQSVLAVTDTLVIALLLSLAVLSVAAGSYSPFLYFRF
jgi:hypothetical protein